jgi:hypothetical protein
VERKGVIHGLFVARFLLGQSVDRARFTLWLRCGSRVWWGRAGKREEEQNQVVQLGDDEYVSTHRLSGLHGGGAHDLKLRFGQRLDTKRR